MKFRVLLYTFLFTSVFGIAQSDPLIDSLKSDPSNQILVFQSNCSGCIVMNPPCEVYSDNGNPWDKYIFWKNKKGFHVIKINNCGRSKQIDFKKWKNNPFDLIKNNKQIYDTTELKYPLSLNTKDSTWFESDINHYKYYSILFPATDMKEKVIKDYAFYDYSEEDLAFSAIDPEMKKNIPRYSYNNNSIIKKNLEILIQKTSDLNLVD